MNRNAYRRAAISSLLDDINEMESELDTLDYSDPYQGARADELWCAIQEAIYDLYDLKISH